MPRVPGMKVEELGAQVLLQVFDPPVALRLNPDTAFKLADLLIRMGERAARNAAGIIIPGVEMGTPKIIGHHPYPEQKDRYIAKLLADLARARQLPTRRRIV